MQGNIAECLGRASVECVDTGLVEALRTLRNDGALCKVHRLSLRAATLRISYWISRNSYSMYHDSNVAADKV